MKHKKMQWIIFCILLISVLVLFFTTNTTKKSEKEKSIFYSVILYHNMDFEWTTLQEGIDQAADDCGVKVRYVTMKENGNAQDQKELIRKEIEAGSSGILLAAVDSEEIAAFIEENRLNTPIQMIETGAGENHPAISADNYEMGCILAEKIIEDMNARNIKEKTVKVVTEYKVRDSVEQRYQGLKETLEKADVQIEEISRKKGDFSLRLFIGTMLKKSGEYVAALDKFCTEEAALAATAVEAERSEIEVPVNIYGIGNTIQTVASLDNGNITALVFQNEFRIGYEGLMSLVSGNVKKGQETDILYKLVTKETLYETENERMLFTSN